MYKVARKYTIGVDEVGRGSCAGPLFVCALGSQMGVSLSKGGNSLPFRDSKKLSEIQREKWLEIFQKMKKDGKIFWSISRISPSVIDKIGISEATKLAATRATLRVVEKHGKEGVDFITIHAGLNRETVNVFKRNPRLNHIVSRGGSLLYAWMELNNKENPFYEHYDRLLEICERYDITLSLGDACRPGSIHDATDASQIKELMVLGELTKRAWEKNVQVMIEGPGHMKLNEIEANMILEKKLCHGAPFYVLGPIVTDVAPGYDHITSAIGGAIAASHGADFLCYVTPAEHLRLPHLEDMKEGIIASRIAAHAGDLAKGIKGADEWDNAMSTARQNLDWEGMFKLAIDPEKARRYRAESIPADEDSCTMCGKMCSMRNMNKVMNGEDIQILSEDSECSAS